MKTNPCSLFRLPCLAAVFAALVPAIQAAPVDLPFPPAADTWVSLNDGPQGTSTVLATLAGADPKHIYLRFRVPMSAGTGTPTEATLTLYQNAAAAGKKLFVYAANNRANGAPDLWAEGMTWGSQPDVANTGAGPNYYIAQANAYAGAGGGDVNFDVAKYISGPGDYTFCIQTDSTTQINFQSKEAANDPVLTITVEGNQDPASEYYRRTVTQIKDRGDLYLSRYRNSSTGGASDVDNIGYIDVTKQPYGAKPNPASDVDADNNTLAIQRAINEARDSQLVLFFPAGTYYVSDTLNAVQGEVPHPKTPPEGTYTSEYFGTLRINSREYPCLLQGARGGARPIIKLRNNSTGFNNPLATKKVVYFWSRLNSSSPEANEDNSHYFQTIDNIDIDLNTSGNTGAIGLSMAAAQGCNISNVAITGTGFYAGLEGAPGPGGYLYGLSVDGGKYGGRFTGGHAPVVINSKFINQASGGQSLVYTDRGTMLLVGVEINGRGISLEPLTASTAWLASLTVVDSRIQITVDGSNPRVAIKGPRSVMLKNVYLLNGGADPAVQLTDPDGGAVQTLMIKDGNGLSGAAYSGWRNYKEWAAGVRLDQTIASLADNIKRVRRWVDGTMSTETAGDIYILPGVIGAPPANFSAGTTNYHVWASVLEGLTFPAGDTGTVINAKTTGVGAFGPISETATDNAARLNSIIANAGTKAVFVPGGEYLIEKPVVLGNTTVLYGLSAAHSALRAKVGGSGATAYNAGAGGAMVNSANSASATSTLADLKLLMPMSADATVFHVLWRAGAGSTVRNVNFDRHITNVTNTTMTVPDIQISGNGGGRWYGTWIESSVSHGANYRHIKVSGTNAVANNPLLFYMFNMEHAGANPQAEFVNADEIRIYQFKAESGTGTERETVHFNNCSNFRLFGMAGAASPASGGNANIEILGTCTNYLVAQIQIQQQLSPAPSSFKRLIDGGVSVPGNEQAVLYKRDDTITNPN
jgi:Pectate lyase superfamily protein